MTDRELFEKALEALELLAWYENPATKVQVRKPRNGGPIVTMYPHKVATEAAAPLRERLAQPEPVIDKAAAIRIATALGWVPPGDTSQDCVDQAQKQRQEQEPVAWMYEWDGRQHLTFTDQRFVEKAHPHFNKSTPLYTTPPRREWVGLTEEEVKSLPQWFPSHETAAVLPLIRAIEAKLREKNT